MTVDANIATAGQRYRVRTKAENERAFHVALRHSRHVVILRKVLPALAALVTASYFISSSMSVTVGDISAASR